MHKSTILQRKLPISSSQKRFWTNEKLRPGLLIHTVPTVLKIEGEYDFDKLENAISKVILKHEVLRSNFYEEDLETYAKISPLDKSRHISLYTFRENEENKVLNLIYDDIRNPFDLENSPLCYFHFYRLSSALGYLVINIHHIIADGWSIEILLKDLWTFYSSPGEELPSEIPSFYAWVEESSKASEDPSKKAAQLKQENFWADYLKDVGTLALPRDYLEDSQIDLHAETIFFDFDEAETNQIKDACKKLGLTPFMFFISAMHLTLAKLSGQNDFAIGTPIAGRSQKELEDMMGLFINTIVVRQTLEKDASFVDFFKKNKGQILKAYINSDLAFEKIVQITSRNGNASSRNLFQAMLAMQNDFKRSDVYQVPGLAISEVSDKNPHLEFELLLDISPFDKKYHCYMQYRTGLFSAHFGNAFVQKFKCIVEKIITDPNSKIADLDLTTSHEKDVLRRMAPPVSKDIWEVVRENNFVIEFEKTAEKYPDHFAVNFKGTLLTYKELNQRANVVAQFLVNHGTRPEEIIALYMERSHYTIICIIGALKANAAFLILDREAPRLRTEAILHETNPKFVLTNQNEFNNIVGISKNEANIKMVEDLNFDQPHSNLNLSVSPENLCYVFYTSGTTGISKGVMIEHKNLINFSQVMQHHVPLYRQHSVKYGFNSSFAVDASLQGLVALLSGHCLHIIPDEVRADSEKTVQFIADNAIELLDGTPRHLKFLIKEANLLLSATRLKTLLVGGDVFEQWLWDELKTNKQIETYNVYGPTACTVNSTIFKLSPEHQKPVLGLPTINTQFYILDENLKQCLPGTVGEIFIGGPSVGRGYLNRSRLSSSSFINNPFSSASGNSRLYRTGDLGRINYEGFLEYVGRKDDQAFWKKYYQDAPFETLIPLDFTRPSECSSIASEAVVILNSLSSDQIKNTSAQLGVTSFTFLFSAFSFLCAKYTRQNDLVIGTPESNEDVTGMFANIQGIRTQVDLKRSFRELALSVEHSLAQIQKRPNYPLEKIVELLNIESAANINPLFQMIFSVNSFQHLNADLSLNMRLHDEKVEISFQYNSEIYNQKTIEILGEHYHQLIKTLINNPQISNQDITIHSFYDEEILPVPQYKNTLFESYIEQFEKMVVSYPERIAIECDDQRLTYTELNERANALAFHLRMQGAGKEQIIAIVLDRSVEYMVCIIAIWKAQAAYLPIDIAQPQKRINDIIEDANPLFILSRSEYKPLYAYHLEKCIDLSTVNFHSHTENLNLPTGPYDLLYIIFTSGTTGKPKGVMIEQQNLINHQHMLLEFIDYYDEKKHWKFALNSPFHFDVSLSGILALLTGHCVNIIPTDVRLNPELFVRYIGDHGLHVLDATPTHGELLVSSDLLKMPNQLKCMILAGEPLTNFLWKTLLNNPQIDSYNAYGPTEATVYTTIVKITENTPKPTLGLTPSIHTHLLYLDENFLPVPLNTYGEVFIGGPNVGRGYLNREDLTAEKFVTNIPGHLGKRYYRSGDIARVDSQGLIEFFGRNDGQVKIRGFRIEIGEIEFHLKAMPNVLEAIVIDRDFNQEKVLVGFIVTKDTLTPDEVKTYLKSKLPDYMVPNFIIELPELPRNASSKIDRKKLNDYEIKTTSLSETTVELNSFENSLFELIKQTLKNHSLRISDHFFAAGGHSLSSIMVVNKCKKTFSVDIEANALFKYPVLIDFIRHVQSLQKSSSQELISKMPADALPVLSFAQERIWFLDKFYPGDVAYNMHSALQISGNLDIEAFKKASFALIQKHPALRTRFTENNEGMLFQDVIPFETYLERYSSRLFSTEKITPSTDPLSLIEVEVNRPFNLEEPPLFYVKIFIADDLIHVLFNIHHIISDGWSMDIFYADLWSFYSQFKNNPHFTPPLELQRIQYTDFAYWQKKYYAHDSKHLLENQNFWKKYYKDAPFETTLPTDFVRPAERTNDGREMNIVLENLSPRDIKKASAQLGVTPFIFLLSAFSFLSAKYIRQNDLVIGTPVAARNDDAIENIIGLFTNTLAVRIQIDFKKSFRDFALSVAQSFTQTQNNVDFPLEKVIELLNVNRATNITPLFQMMFTLIDLQDSTKQPVSELSIRHVSAPINSVKFDLSVFVAFSEEKISVSLQYSSELYTQKTIEIFCEHYKELLKTLVNNPQISNQDVKIHSCYEENFLLAPTFANNSFESYISNFEAMAKLYPKRISTECAEQNLTYEELNERANSLAHHLRERGAGKEKIVAIMLDRSVEFLVSIIAIWKAQAAYLPIDISQPQERINDIIEDANPILIISHPEYRALYNRHSKKYFDLSAVNYDAQKENLNLPVTPHDLAYIIFTSGTTGKPKGVMIEQQNLMNLKYMLLEFIDFYREGTPWKFALNSPFHFDVSLSGVVALLTGHCVNIIPTPVRMNPELFVEYIGNHGINVLDCTPTHGELLINSSLLTTQNQLKSLVLAGEPVSDFLWKMMLGSPQIDSYNAYGPTEATVYTTIVKITENTPKPTLGLTPSIHTHLLYLDENFLPVPVNTYGEVFIGGPNVGRGYLNREDLTAEKFVTNIPGHLGERYYRSGDIARVDSQGLIEFFGRNDGQVKIRGFRIEIGEIEFHLKAMPNVLEAIVIDRDFNQEKVLVGFIVTKDTLTPDEVKTYLKSKVPDYMVPSFIVELPELPRNASSKVDRKKLNEFILNAPSSSTQDIELNSFEREFLDLIKQTLKNDHLKANDHFFAIGGHSLSSIMLVNRCKKTFNVDIEANALFKFPVLIDFMRHVQSLQKRSPQAQISKMPQDVLPTLSFAQERIWFLDKFYPGDVAYNMHSALQVRGHLNLAALKKAIFTLIHKHPTLRTRFTENNEGALFQDVIPFETYLNKYSNRLFVLTNIARHSDPLSLIEAEVNRPFNLEEPPLFYVKLFISDDLIHVLFNMHHIISDGWSMDIFYKDLWSFYSQFDSDFNFTPKLSFGRIQYIDFAHWQKNHYAKDSRALLENQKFWKKYYQDAPFETVIPADFVRPTERTNAGHEIELILNSISPHDIKKTSLSMGVTPFVFLLSAFSFLMAKYTRQSDLVIGTPIAARTDDAIEDIVGLFANTLAIRAQIDLKQSFKQFAKVVAHSFAQTQNHADFPIEKVIELLNVNRTTNITPLFQTLFTVVDLQESLKQPVHALNIRHVSAPIKSVKFDLSVSVGLLENDVSVSLHYSTELYSQKTIEIFSEHFNELLKILIHNPQISNQDIIIHSAYEKALLPTPKYGDHEFESYVTNFQTIAKRYPERIALECGEQSLTYSELNQRANVLAYHLRELGAGKEKIIAIMLDRSVEFVVSIIAIWKAQAAYLPIDISQPQERINDIIEDANPILIISDSTFAPFCGGFIGRYFDLQTVNFNLQNGDLNLPTDPQDLAYVIFTSGTTGKPKGVMIEQKNLSNFKHMLSNFIDFYHEENHYKFALNSPFHFDVSLAGIMALLNGHSVNIIPAPVRMNSELFIQYISNHRIHVLDCTPTHGELLINSHLLQAHNHLKSIVFCGEPVSEFLWRTMLASPQIVSYNAYGPTETTVYTTVIKIDEHSPNPTLGPIPTAQTHLLFLDDNMTSVPVNTYGEVYIGGPNVGRGYLNRDDLTTEKFITGIPDHEGKRYYRTGDVARVIGNGSIEFLGRNDSQVKIRGFRIEIGEIEFHLKALPEVLEAVVTDREFNQEKILVAYVVTKNKLTGHEIKVHLRTKVPEYMVPSFIIELPELPRNASSKVDRKKLPAPSFELNSTDQKLLFLLNDEEKQMALIWKEILGHDQFHKNTSFFEVGGTSLSVLMVIDHIKKKLNKHISVKTIFEHPTLSDFAETVFHGTNHSNGNLIKLTKDESSQNIICVHGAEGLPFGFYNLARLLNGKVNVYAFQFPNHLTKEMNFDRLSEIYYREILSLNLPYSRLSLVGYSAGGIVAFDLVKKLGLKDLIILDGHIPSLQKTITEDERFLEGIIPYLTNLLPTDTLTDDGIGHILDFLNAFKTETSFSIIDVISVLKKKMVTQKINENIAIYDSLLTYLSLIDFTNNHYPEKQNVDLHLLKSVDKLETFGEDYGWSQYINGDTHLTATTVAHHEILTSPESLDIVYHLILKKLGTRP